MSKLDMVPQNIADMITVLRNPDERRHYRENVAATLDTIACLCRSEVDRYRGDRDRRRS